MINSKFSLILTETGGNYATPDITITDALQTTFSIQNVADISQRKDTLTQAISFPGTKNNNRIFNNLYSFNRDADNSLEETLFFNYSPVVGVRAVLFENNYPIVSGVLTIQSIVKDANGAFTYTGIITGNLVNFFGKLRDTLLQDLTLFTDTIDYTWDTIANSWAFADDKKFVFPNIDYGKGIAPDKTKFDIRNYRPGIYFRQYIKALLALYGYRYKSTFIDSALFKNAYMPFVDVDFGSVVTGDVIVFNGGTLPQQNMNRSDASTVLTGLYINDFSANDYVLSSQQNAHGVNGGWGRKTVKNDRPVQVFEFKKASKTGATIAFDFKIFSHAKTTAVYVQVFNLYSSVVNLPFIGNVTYPYTFDADNALATFSKGFGTEAKLVWTEIQGTVQLPVDNYDKGMRFAVIITTVTDKGDDLELQQISTKITFGNPDVTVGSVFSYDLGDTFNLNTVMPKAIKAQDLLKSIFTFFNMYAVENPDDDQELIIEPYDLFYSKVLSPSEYALDWTKKVDNKTLAITVNTALPKTYAFKFASDGDFYNTLYSKTYGVDYGNFTINNSIGTADEKDITGIFAPTVVVTEDKDDKTMPAIFSGELLAKKAFAAKPRILFNNGSAPCAPFDVVLTSGEAGALHYEMRQANVQSYNISHHVNGSLINGVFGLPKAVYYTVTSDVFNIPTLYGFYTNQLIELDDINIFTLAVDVHLRDYDINKIDLSRPIFISTTQGAAYFKVMSVIYYNSDEVSKVTLQKIILTDGGGSSVPPVPPAHNNFKSSASYNLSFAGITGDGIPPEFATSVNSGKQSGHVDTLTAGDISVTITGVKPPITLYLRLVRNSTQIISEVVITGADTFVLHNPTDLTFPGTFSIEIDS